MRYEDVFGNRPAVDSTEEAAARFANSYVVLDPQRWFVGMNLDDEIWDLTTSTKNRERLLNADVAREFLSEIVKQAREQGWTSDEHFTVDGTLIEA